MSEIKTLEIPKWGLSMEEGTIAQWLIEEGTQFDKGQEICEIETTKIVNVLEAPFPGILRKIIAKNGDTLQVGGVIALCADAGVSDEEIEMFAQSLTGKVATPESETVLATEIVTSTVLEQQSQQVITDQSSRIAPQPSICSGSSAVVASDDLIPLSLQGYQPQDDLFITPHALKLARQYNLNLALISGSGRQGRISVADLQQAVEQAGGQWPVPKQQQKHIGTKILQSTADDQHLAATPVARRLAKQWGINLHDCRISGSRGRICRADVEAVYHRQHAQIGQHQAEAVHHNTPSNVAVAPAVTTIAMNSMRKAIASRLQAAKRNAPHFRLSLDLKLDAIQILRQQINTTVPQLKLSINDVLIKAVAAALMKVPQVNVQFDEQQQQILQFDQADIAVAVAIDNGLITPIIKAANSKSLAQISQEMRDLATRAKTGRLAIDEFQGGVLVFPI